MDSTANILQFCRLCLVKDGVNIPIFDEQGDIRQIYLKISSCLPVKVAREDHLPKKICDGCSNKLDICYDFWRTSAESEKQLLAWLGATGKDAAQVNVKEEDNFDEPLASDISKNDDDENKCYMFEQKVEEGPPVEINDEPPPSKRPRRTAAVKAAIAMDQNSDDDGDSGEPITKMEDDSDETDGDDREPAFVDVPSTSADDQPGPSGVSKDGSDAPMEQRVMDIPPPVEVKIEYDNEEFRCKQCLKLCKSKKQLYFHEKMVHAPEIHPCDVCGKKFKQKSYVRVHKELLHGNGRKFKCDACDSQFKCKQTLSEHEKRVHLKLFEIFCKECGKGFRAPSKLGQHQRIKHDKILYSCTECGKQFESREGFSSHMEKHSDSQYTCTLCEKVFKYKNLLRRHKCQNKTDETRKYVCDRCGVELSSTQVLRKHINAHNGIKPYKCEVCHHRLATFGGLQSHRRIHTDEKPYACTFCEKCFRQKSGLNLHLRTHTGEAPYHCEVCTKNFISKAALKSHVCQGPIVGTDTDMSDSE